MDLIEKKLNDNRHPWELSRIQCILGIVKKHPLRTIVDIGAGDRFFTSKLTDFVSGALYAIDTGYAEKQRVLMRFIALNIDFQFYAISYLSAWLISFAICKKRGDSVV